MGIHAVRTERHPGQCALSLHRRCSRRADGDSLDDGAVHGARPSQLLLPLGYAVHRLSEHGRLDHLWSWHREPEPPRVRRARERRDSARWGQRLRQWLPAGDSPGLDDLPRERRAPQQRPAERDRPAATGSSGAHWRPRPRLSRPHWRCASRGGDRQLRDRVSDADGRTGTRRSGGRNRGDHEALRGWIHRTGPPRRMGGSAWLPDASSSAGCGSSS